VYLGNFNASRRKKASPLIFKMNVHATNAWWWRTFKCLSQNAIGQDDPEGA